ncbi:hypothetical protein HDV00_005396 [Rhizophlyctis rosea]|nr:hypothetical protein HDV00_005396 [Rhizophlyctis rosea]
MGFVEDDDVPELPPELDLSSLPNDVADDVRPAQNAVGGLAGAFGAGLAGAAAGPAAGAAQNNANGKKKRNAGPRGPMPKIDAQRLLSPAGLPRLKELSTKVKFKGKGHEVENLQKLITFYQIWGHELYPKAPFRQFVERVEKVCKQRHLKVFLNSVIQEERRQKMNILADHGEDNEIRDDDYIMGDVEEDDAPANVNVDNGIDVAAAYPATIGTSAAASTFAPAPVFPTNNQTAEAEPELRLSGTSTTLSEETLAKIKASRAKALEKLAEKQRQKEEERRAAAEREEEQRRAEEERRISAMIADAPLFIDED